MFLGHCHIILHVSPANEMCWRCTACYHPCCVCHSTFIRTDSESFSLFTIFIATFCPVMQWTPNFTRPEGGTVGREGRYKVGTERKVDRLWEWHDTWHKLDYIPFTVHGRALWVFLITGIRHSCILGLHCSHQVFNRWIWVILMLLYYHVHTHRNA